MYLAPEPRAARRGPGAKIKRIYEGVSIGGSITCFIGGIHHLRLAELGPIQPLHALSPSDLHMVPLLGVWAQDSAEGRVKRVIECSDSEEAWVLLPWWACGLKHGPEF